MLLALAFLVAFPAGSAPGPDEPVRHDLSVVLFPEEGLLRAVDTITMAPGKESRTTFSLSGKVRVTSVSVDGKEHSLPSGDGPLTIAHDGKRDGKPIVVRIAYEGTFRDPTPEDPVNTEDPSFGVVGTISPGGVFLSDGADWYPEVPGRSATFRVRVEAPAGFEAVTAGKRIRRETSGGRTFSEWETTYPVRGLPLSAGRYVVRDRTVGNVTVSTYFFPGNDPLSGKYLDAAERYLRLYETLLGPYPFEKFAVVENFFPTGYGFPSWTLLGSTVVSLPFIIDTSLGHEIAHSWWGNGVFVDPRGGNWSEGLTTYVADHLYKERASPAEGREYRLKILRDYATLVPPGSDFPVERFAGRVSPATQAVGYGKTAMIFHMARREIGDEAFWAGLRSVVRDRLFRTASWDDLSERIGSAAGRDMGPFFRRWIGSAGAPFLSLSDVRAERDGKGWSVTGRVRQEKPAYDLKVPVRLETAGKPVDLLVSLSGEQAPFVIASDDHPRSLLLDPDVDLFRRLHPSEIPPTVNGIRGSGDLAVVVAKGFPRETAEAARILLAAMGRERLPLFREEDTSPEQLADRDVLYFGLPSGKAYLPAALPRELSLAAAKFTLNGTEFAASGDALFAVLPHPSAAGRVAAIFLPLSPEAANAAGRKIPH
ncbi:MAG TPA: M1 family aminopeptidase, partial [Candidatus Methylomirabilis sp.]|nr:M1 family aminopeptidase [Candidatus Methylomirabilis sp.]